MMSGPIRVVPSQVRSVRGFPSLHSPLALLAMDRTATETFEGLLSGSKSVSQSTSTPSGPQEHSGNNLPEHFMTHL